MSNPNPTIIIHISAADGPVVGREGEPAAGWGLVNAAGATGLGVAPGDTVDGLAAGVPLDEPPGEVAPAFGVPVAGVGDSEGAGLAAGVGDPAGAGDEGDGANA